MVLIEAQRDKRRRQMTRAAERETLVRAYEESGLTQKAFAKQEEGDLRYVRVLGAGVPTAAPGAQDWICPS